MISDPFADRAPSDEIDPPTLIEESGLHDFCLMSEQRGLVVAVTKSMVWPGRRGAIAAMTVAALLAVMAVGIGTVNVAISAGSSAALIKCATENADIQPASRAAICLCFVERSRSFGTTILRLVSSETTERRSRRVSFNECVSAEFALNQPGGRGAKPLAQ
ncbi:MAG TPA: hypothetical protein VGO04_13745 [Ensifer sp.]|jgi:hypothetical protein|uniref:hypothetical protein n=1 Tax=Ensifer sp. TaxID=1872086 RepID=UPI002E0D3C01|nr:hypothetical protein [Ensifer sp.]